MFGESTWLDPMLMVLGGAGIIVGIRALGAQSGSLLRRRMDFVCPVQHQRVSCAVIDDLQRGEIKDVARCSAWPGLLFRRPCTKRCLESLNRGDLLEIGLGHHHA